MKKAWMVLLLLLILVLAVVLPLRQPRIVEEQIRLSGNDAVNIRCPQLSGKGFEEVNARIRARCVEGIREGFAQNEDGTVSLDVTYTVALHTRDMLSLRFDGYAYAAGRAHPNAFCCAITLDLKDGCEIPPEKLIGDSAQISALLEAGSASVVYGGLKAYDQEAIKETIRLALDKQNGLRAFAYTDGQQNYLIVDGLAHALGDYAILAFDEAFRGEASEDAAEEKAVRLLEESYFSDFYLDGDTVVLRCCLVLQNESPEEKRVVLSCISEEDVENKLLAEPELTARNADGSLRVFTLPPETVCRFDELCFYGRHGGGDAKQNRLLPEIVIREADGCVDF